MNILLIAVQPRIETEILRLRLLDEQGFGKTVPVLHGGEPGARGIQHVPVRDIELRSSPNDVVQLEAFTVTSSREMSQAAIATIRSQAIERCGSGFDR